MLSTVGTAGDYEMPPHHVTGVPLMNSVRVNCKTGYNFIKCERLEARKAL